MKKKIGLVLCKEKHTSYDLYCKPVVDVKTASLLKLTFQDCAKGRRITIASTASISNSWSKCKEQEIDRHLPIILYSDLRSTKTLCQKSVK